MDFNGLREFWIAYRKHRELFQLPGEEKDHKPPRASAAARSQMVGKAVEVNSGRVYQKDRPNA